MATTRILTVMTNPPSKDFKEEKDIDPVDIVMVGAGPVGLDAALKLGKDIVILEKYTQYMRSQPLELNINLIEDLAIRKELLSLLGKQGIKRLGKNRIQIPIKILENIFLKHAVQSKHIKILHRQFMTKEQYENALRENNADSREDLEKKLGVKVIVGIAEIVQLYPRCKIIIGADGARSSVREALDDSHKVSVNTTTFRNMIEMKYQVAGRAEKLFDLDYFTMQPLLQGFLCTEHLVYNAEKNITEIALRFLVDTQTYNDPRLEGVNAKHLLPLTTNIPDKLAHAITMWINKRGDKNIILTSPTLNKTVLALYASEVFCQFRENVLVLLKGDAACGFPFMNGLNLGIENSTRLVKLIHQYYDAILKQDQSAIREFLAEYTRLTQEILEKGIERVTKQNNKINQQETSVKVLKYSTYGIKIIAEAFLDQPHPIFYAHSFADENLITYINNTRKRSMHPDKLALCHNLLAALKSAKNDFSYVKALLILAYQKNLTIESNKTYSFFWQSSTMKSRHMHDLSDVRLDAKEIAAINPNQNLPAVLTNAKGKKLSQHLHVIIKNLHTKALLLEAKYKDEMKSIAARHIPKEQAARHEPAEVVNQYLGF